MSQELWPAGLMTALVTPLKDDGIDLEATRQLVEMQVQAGVSGVVVGGGTGEHGALSFGERKQLFNEVAAALAGRIPFVLQTGALATRDAIKLSTYAQEIGALGILLPSPFGEALNWRERLAFYKSVNEAISIPIMLYNSHSAGSMTLTQIETIAQLSNVSAIKQSSADVMLLGDLLLWADTQDFRVYIGEDSLLPTAVLAGAHGAVLGSGNVVPEELVHVMRLCREGQLTPELASAWGRLRPVIRFMEQAENYIAICKVGLRLRGLEVGDVRAPYLMPSDDEAAAFADQLRTLQEAAVLV